MKRALIAFLATLYLAGLVLVGASYYAGFREVRAWPPKAAAPATAADAAKAAKSLKALQRKMDGLLPKGLYIVVDTGENRLYVKKGDEIVRQSVVSCGSGDILEEPGGKRKWTFDTPRGEFTVTSKITNPYWVKPDWAFIEEGEKIPKNPEERVEAGSLGDYALGFGDGFFIHGTLYTRLLGRNVTHGCVRVGDNDLKEIFKIIPVGTKIYIY